MDILVGAGRFYSRMGVPYLLDEEGNIYATAVTPLVTTEEALRKILYDFLFMRSDRARDYRHTSQDGIDRLREYETSNRSTVMGLSRMSDGLVHPEL
ncbi:hypothetical protein AB0D08_32150 [Kitasatospora sp. NPDC048540]|uniref:hypothetical protein n=1 Tax=Kitasatospora sp. NPDC048540 TaxID=3155634 RepID=UPI0033CEEBAF